MNVGDRVEIRNTVPRHLRRYVGKTGRIIEIVPQWSQVVLEVDGDQDAAFQWDEVRVIHEDQHFRAAPTLPGLVEPGLEGE
jgi:hypothetical protein